MEDKSEKSEKQDIRLEILATVKVSQSQNGLKHQDYERYRQYCCRRLRRIRKALKLSHGKHFKKRVIDPKSVSDARWLSIPLFHSERAWSYAMQVKDDIQKEDNRRKRFHLIKRLSKAVSWSTKLAKLCEEKADPQTQLQAEAYSAWMSGNLLLEQDKLKEAYERFSRSKQVYGNLGKQAGGKLLELCSERITQLQPRLRYCEYRLSKSQDGTKDKDEKKKMEIEAESEQVDLETDAPNDELLKSKLDAVFAEKVKKQGQSMDSITWQGKSVPITNEKVKICIFRAQDLTSHLKSSKNQSEEDESHLSAFQEIFALYDDIARQIRDELKQATGLAKEHLQKLLAYSRWSKLKLTEERNTQLAETLSRRFQEQERQRKQEEDTKKGKKEGKEGKEGGKKEKKVKADELVVVYEKLMQNMTELGELEQTQTKQSDKEIEGKTAAFRALRCFYLAEAYRRLSKWTQAFLLYGLAIDLVKEVPSSLKSLSDQVKAMKDDATALRYSVHAQGLLDLELSQSEVTQSVKNLKLEELKAGDSNFLQSLDLYKAASVSGQSQLTQFPPTFKAAPSKPILFDLAFNYLQPPKLEQRIPKTKPKTVPPAKTAQSPTSPSTTSTKATKAKSPPPPVEDDKDKEKEKGKGWLSSLWSK